MSNANAVFNNDTNNVVNNDPIDADPIVQVDPAEEKEQNPLQHTSTGVILDEVVKKQRKQAYHSLFNAIWILVAVGFSVVGMIDVDESCETKPISWEYWYLGNVVISSVAVIVTLALIYAATKINNVHMLTATVHQMKGKEDEAEKDRELGMPEWSQGMKIISGVIMFACCDCLVGFSWFVIGIVIYANNGDDACADSKKWFWFLFVARLLSGSTSGRAKALNKKT